MCCTRTTHRAGAVATLRNVQDQLSAANAEAARWKQLLDDERSLRSSESKELRHQAQSAQQEVEQLRQLALELKDELARAIAVRLYPS
jgi:uncharacterized protein YdcH (DUF465 family)